MSAVAARFTNLFPLWTVLAGITGLVYPPAITWMKGPWITVGLAVIMLGMGLTLAPVDFRRVLLRPWPVALGVALQYTVMPAAGYALARLFTLPPELAAGLILVACCPGGTASNVIAFLARVDVPLSVTMTALSTLLAAILTPALTYALAGSYMEISPLRLLLDTVQVVLAPIAAGVLLNRYLRGFTARLIPFAPAAAVIAIALIVGSVLGAKRDVLLESGGRVILAVVCLHATGFLLGYLASRLFVDETSARTISIEVGMQNSGLGVELANRNFPGRGADLPAAISATVHSLFGSALAALWRRAVQ
jgi:bile acid:Na+ symporter, BASS family